MCPPLAELAHRRFADHYWATGTWPALGSAAILRLARVSGPRFELLLTELKTLGWAARAGRLRNPGVADTLQRAMNSKKARVAAGLLGAAVRWPAAKATPTAADLPPSTPELFPAPPTPTPAVAPPLACPGTVPAHSNAIAELMLSHSTHHAEPMPNQCLTNSTKMPINKVSNEVRKECTKGSTLLSEQGTPLTLLNSEPLTVNPLTSPLTVSRRKGEAGSEKDFLADVREQFTSYSPERAESELTNFGGWWRNRFRENPDRARRVLAEIGSMCRERRIHSSPGAAAADLWSRLP